MIWWLAFEKKPFQFWREIWIQVVIILLQLYKNEVRFDHELSNCQCITRHTDNTVIWIHLKNNCIYRVSPSNNGENNVEVNFNIHVMTSPEMSKTTNTGPLLTITNSTEDAEKNGSMTNAQQNAMSNMFKQFFK